MTKERLEHLSIILEVLGFFIAAVDLIGRVRIHQIETWIREKIISLKNAKNSKKYKFISSLVILSFLAYISYNLGSFFSNYYKDIALASGGILVMMLIAYFGTVFIEKLFFNVLLVVTTGINKLLNLFPFEGILVAIGAVLFLVAKSIAYYIVEMKWVFDLFG